MTLVNAWFFKYWSSDWSAGKVAYLGVLPGFSNSISPLGLRVVTGVSSDMYSLFSECRPPRSHENLMLLLHGSHVRNDLDAHIPELEIYGFVSSGEIQQSAFQWTSVFSFSFCLFGERVFLCSPGHSDTNFVEQAGLQPKVLPASASQILGLKVCASTLQACFWMCGFSAQLMLWTHSPVCLIASTLISLCG